MTDGCFLGIDTSNYTTSVAVVAEDGKELANLKYSCAYLCTYSSYAVFLYR